MGTKKKGGTSKKQVRKKKKVHATSELKKAVAGLLILVAVCFTGAMIADILIQPPESVPVDTKKPLQKTFEKKSRPAPDDSGTLSSVDEDDKGADLKKPQSGLMGKNGHPVLYEVFEGMEDARPTVPGSRPEPVDGSIRIALIIDDIGYDKKIALALHDLEPNISFSVLPWSPFGRAISGILADRGAEIMLHLPMEPMEYPKVNPGPGALLAGMPPDVLIAQLEKNMDEVPGACGVNNHMGSRLTTEASQMYQIFTILKKSDLFFIDSVTAPKSQCRAAARLLQVQFGERDVFLDNIQEVAYITGQFARLKKIARKHGGAIGIGHPYPATLETLKIELPKIKGKIKIIPASQIVAIPG
ncbi:MAG: divergent polysaccharide deacetylase family protein [Desulfotignum sp.]|nr:divergent polysaccharide deacetylase family protein [Desulfotignum sp.]